MNNRLPETALGVIRIHDAAHDKRGLKAKASAGRGGEHRGNTWFFAMGATGSLKAFFLAATELSRRSSYGRGAITAMPNSRARASSGLVSGMAVK